MHAAWLSIAAVVTAGCGRADEPARAPPPPTAPAVVDVPGRPPDPLVVYAAGSEPPPAAPDAPGMRGVIARADAVYFLDSRAHQVVRVPRDGGAITRVGWNGTSGAFAVTSTHAYVARDSTLDEIALAGGERRGLAWGTDTPVQDFAVDGDRYYTVSTAYYGQGPNGPSGALASVSLAAGADRVVLADKLPGPVAIALDPTHAYFAAQARIGRVPRAGGVVEVVADLDDDYGWMVEVGGGHVYFTAQTSTTVALSRVPVGGGPIERLAGLQMQPTSLAFAGGALYFIAESDRKEVGTLWRLDLATRTLDALAVDLVGYPFVSASDGVVAWTSGEAGFILPAQQSTPIRIHSP